MDLTKLINHPELMDRDTLYDLRSLIALYPCFQTARILMLQNLYLLHDATFDEELRRSAIYITDRRVLFNLVEAAHYQLPHAGMKSQEQTAKEALTKKAKESDDRTISLIDNFLDSIPKENEEPAKEKRKPTPADAAVDYVSYLLETEREDDGKQELPQMKGQELIDNFINIEGGKIQLHDETQYVPVMEKTAETNRENNEEDYFTETLAKIYIKQGRYDKAIEIIKRLNLIYPKKNAYFADQIRFLEKLRLNDKAVKKQ